MVTNLFIDRQYVIENTNIQKNVLEIDRYIKEAHLLYVNVTLGHQYAKVLYDNYINNRVIDGTLEAYVLEYVKLAAAYYTVSLILPNIHYKFTETSVIVKEGGDNIAVEGRDLQYLIQLNKQNGDRYMDKALDIIKENPNMFPFFYINNEKQQDIKQYGSIVFYDSRNC
jgi:hypothetical protein